MKLTTWHQTKSWDRTTRVVFALLIAAFVLRIWGIWFGLPHIFHNDEGFEIIRALRLGTGDYDFTRIGKGGYFYLLFVEYALLFVALFGFGIIESPSEFGELYIRDPSVFYLIGRTTTALIGTATIYVVYRLGQIAYTSTAAVVGAALLTVNVLHADLSHYATVDVPMTFLCTAALYFAVKIVQGGRPTDYWIAALMAAFATSTKMPAVLVLIPLLIAHGGQISKSAGGFKAYLLDKRLWQSAAIFVGAYAITTPGIIFYFDDVFLNAISKFASGINTDTSAVEVALDERALVANTNLFRFYLEVLATSMSWPVFAVCVIGLFYALWRRRPVDLVLASFPILIYLVMSSSVDSRLFFPRYMLPAIPPLVLLGGRLIDDFAQSLSGRAKIPVIVTGVIALAVMPSITIMAENILKTRTDTRTEAREWVESNIEAGARIFIEGHRTTVTKSTVPLQNSAENLRESIVYFRDREPGKAHYFKMALKVLSGKTYDLVGVSPEELRDLQYYKDIGIQYFILRPNAYERSRQRYEWPDLVDEIRQDNDVILIQKFEPDPRRQPGPTIEIYRVTSNVELREIAD